MKTKIITGYTIYPPEKPTMSAAGQSRYNYRHKKYLQNHEKYYGSNNTLHQAIDDSVEEVLLNTCDEHF